MIAIVCDRCKRACDPVVEIEPKILTIGQPETVHLCSACWNMFLNWCKFPEE